MIQSKTLFQTGKIHGIPINVSNIDQALSEVETLIQLREHHYVCFFEGNLFFHALFDKEVHDVIAGASLIYPDGIVLQKELEWHLRQCVSRVSGPSFMLRACEYGVARQWRHFFLGGGDGVAQKLADNLKSKNPGMIVAGCYTPPFRDLTEEEEIQVKAMIEESRADLLWVGLGGPKQEFWMKRHLKKINVPVMLGVGAAFDFHSGRRTWAPRWVRKLGLEWLYRTFCGGSRIFMRNMKTIPLLCLCVLFDYVARLFRPAAKITARVPGQQN